METIRMTCREINGENGVFLKTGNQTVTFVRAVPSSDGKRLENKIFIVDNVNEDNAFANALTYVEFCYCGYLYLVCPTNFS